MCIPKSRAPVIENLVIYLLVGIQVETPFRLIKCQIEPTLVYSSFHFELSDFISDNT